mgnify:CR=1 FL=1
MKIALAGPYPAGTLEQFQALLPDQKFFPVETQEAYEALTDVDCIIVRVLKTPEPVLDNKPNLKAVIRWGAGYDSVDIQAAGRRGIPVLNTPGVNAYAVAELALDMMITLNRKVLGYWNNVQQGNWDRGAFASLSLNHKTVGIVGGGNIGRRVAALVQALGAQVIYYDAFRLAPEREQELHMTYVSLDELVEAGDLYFALLCGGLWTLVYRLILVRYYVHKYKIPPISKEKIEPLGTALKQGGSSLAMFLGIIIPLVVITGPVATLLEGLASFGEDGVDAMNIIIWVPVLIMLICLIEGRKLLPKTLDGWAKMLLASAKQCCNCGAVSLFAMASSNALNQTSFGEDMTTILSALTLPKFVLILIIGYVIALAAGPMNATSTTVSLGPVAYSAMVSVGVPPVTAIVAYLIFASTEGASPPMSSPIFVSSSIAGLNDVSVMFKPLIFHYCIPIVFVGVLVAMGILPIIGG